ncbi:hypothetical protein L1275_000811 [Flavobacterium sp. HSC-61S13]|nr:hypothetical protein [Flavobacterium sp. HSC-61S13]
MMGIKFMNIRFIIIVFLTSTVTFGQVNGEHLETSERLVLNNLNNHLIEIVELVCSENKEI